jgi:hypothetical protein
VSWRAYLLNVLVALDVLANCILCGQPGETISERAGAAMAAGKRWGCILCRLLDRIAPSHCANAAAKNHAAHARTTGQDAGAT